MALPDNALGTLVSTRYPIWQAPLPFSIFLPSTSGRISAAGGMGLLRVGEADNRATLAEALARYEPHDARPGICFSHRLPRHAQGGKVSRDEALRFGLSGEPAASDDFVLLLDTALGADPRAIGFSGGIPEQDTIASITARRIPTFAICRNLLEALAAADFGIDVLVLQGSEAGGERAGCDNRLACPALPAMSLLQEAREHLEKPLVAWGDFSHGADVVAALIAGAQAVMIERPLLSCRESGLDPALFEQLQSATEYDSLTSNTYTARAMRHLRTQRTLPASAATDSREQLVRTYLAEHPDAVPLPVAPTRCAQSDTLSDYFTTLETQMRAYLG